MDFNPSWLEAVETYLKNKLRGAEKVSNKSSYSNDMVIVMAMASRVYSTVLSKLE